MKYDDWSLDLFVRRKIYKQDIIDTGSRLMHTYGYTAVSIKDITDSLEIPKGSFYNHFENKNAFLVEVLKNYAEESYVLVEKHLLNKSISPLQRLKNYFDEAASDYANADENLSGCLMGNICQELGNVNPEIQTLLEHNFNGVNEIIANLLEEGLEKGEFEYSSDVHELVQFITNSWQGALLRMKSAGSQTPLHTFQNILFNHILTK